VVRHTWLKAVTVPDLHVEVVRAEREKAVDNDGKSFMNMNAR